LKLEQLKEQFAREKELFKVAVDAEDSAGDEHTKHILKFNAWREVVRNMEVTVVVFALLAKMMLMRCGR
jgi:hypothetical protein